MTILSGRTSGYLSFLLYIVVLVSLSLSVFPANAKTSGNNSASSNSNLAQLAQTQICKRPNLMINGVCRRGIIRQRCDPPNRMINGRCTSPAATVQKVECPRFFVRVRDECVRLGLQKTCPPSQSLIGDRCVSLAAAVKCLPPLVRIDGKCTSLNVGTPPCVAPRKFIRGECRVPGVPLFPVKCKPPLKRINGVCKLPPQFVCASPRIRKGPYCVLPNPSCQASFVRSPITNRCYLPFEIDLILEAECHAPSFYFEQSGGCVKLRPRPRARENAIWVQSCLNTLGYRAGVEDGIAGRQTRSAWEDFRRAIGVRGIVGFDDPETLSALYRECNSEPR